VTLKSRSEVIEGHWKWHHSIDRSHTSSYSSSIIVTMAVSCAVFEIKRDIVRKRRFCRAMLCISVANAVMRCLSRSWMMSKRINIPLKVFHHRVATHTILVWLHQTGWRYSDAKTPNGGVECRWGRQKSRFYAHIWLSCLLLALQQASVIDRVAGGARPAYGTASTACCEAFQRQVQYT